MARIEYSELVMEHFKNPRNVGTVEKADSIGTVGNPVCGDMMEISIKVEGGRIADIKFKTFGCASAIATSSMLTEIAKGMTLEEAEKLTWNDVMKSLNGLPPIKIHCSMLAIDGLRLALYKYYKERGMDRPDLDPKTDIEDEHHHGESQEESPLV